MSSHFTHRAEHGHVPGSDSRPLTAHELASVLADALGNGLPDEQLLARAEDGSLVEPAVLREQVGRLLEAPETNQAIRDFVAELVHYDGVVSASAPDGVSPLALLSDGDELAAHLLETRGRSGFLEALLTTESFYMTPETAEHYNREVSEPGLVDLEGERVGFFAHPAWLTTFSAVTETQPVQRGRFIRERFFCQEIPIAEIGAFPEIEDPEAMTMRDRLASHVQAECQTCHKFMDGLGLPFEEFAPTGALVEELLGEPVDTSGEIREAHETDVNGPLADHRELMERMAVSHQVGECFASNAFAYFLGRPPRPEDACTIVDAYAAYRESGGDLVALIAELFASRASRTRVPAAPEGGAR